MLFRIHLHKYWGMSHNFLWHLLVLVLVQVRLVLFFFTRKASCQMHIDRSDPLLSHFMKLSISHQERYTFDHYSYRYNKIMFNFSDNIYEDDFSAESKCGRKAYIVGSGARKFGQSKKRHLFSPYSTKHVRGQLLRSEKSRAKAGQARGGATPGGKYTRRKRSRAVVKRWQTTLFVKL